MTKIIIGIGEYAASNEAGAEVKTLALGSCVAVIAYEAHTKTAGMVHVALPESSISPERARDLPGYFADTGVPLLLSAMRQLTAMDKLRGVIIKLVGGANVADPNNTFNIGKRNVLAIKRALWAEGLGPLAEDVGGSISRTVSIDVGTGRTLVHSTCQGQWEV